MKFLLIAMLSLAFFGCRDASMKGKLIVHEDITLNVTLEDPFCDDEYDDDCGQTEEQTFRAGEYSTKLSLNSDKDLALEINGQDYVMVLPRDKNIPEENGSFDFLAAEINQAYDLRGDVATTSTRGEKSRGSESCHFRRHEYVCYSDGRGRTRCGYEWRTVYGRRAVVFIPVHVSKKLNFSMFKSDRKVSAYKGGLDYNYRDVLKRGICY